MRGDAQYRGRVNSLHRTGSRKEPGVVAVGIYQVVDFENRNPPREATVSDGFVKFERDARGPTPPMFLRSLRFAHDELAFVDREALAMPSVTPGLWQKAKAANQIAPQIAP